MNLWKEIVDLIEYTFPEPLTWRDWLSITTYFSGILCWPVSFWIDDLNGKAILLAVQVLCVAIFLINAHL